MQAISIVTAANETYRDILEGLILSIRSHRQSLGVPIVVLDLGLSENTKAWLNDHGARCVVPDWDFAFKQQPPEYFKAMASRPHLPKYVTDAEFIVWLDADTWVQDWRGIELLVQGAAASGFAAVPEVDRSYDPMYGEEAYLNHQYSWLRQCFDDSIARKLCHYPIINCGVFAARFNAPHWAAWADALADSFQRIVLFVSEQTALNVVLRSGSNAASLMPAKCNWICYRAQPFCTPDGRVLLDPQIPHEPLGIVHLAGYPHDQKGGPRCLRTPDGGTVTRPLIYVPT
ncbi:hypothetical protein ABMY26_06860 (plasmid) [Azospirillum sp. HJ39]|uniref:hypothetical protein n=1 Tax=Azospirillum sp. HJ39 TaxID=3159496 RepID=UPI0035573398